MSSHHLQEPRSTDEISLHDVLKKLKAFFLKLVGLFVYLFLIIYRRWIYFLLFVGLGTAIAYAAFITTKPFYTYSMTALLSEVRNDLIEDQIENLVLLVNDNNHAVLAQQLGVSEKSAGSIKSVTFRNLDQNRIPPDSVLANSPFEVTVQLYDNKIHDSIQNGIVNYLENNPYLAKQKQIKRDHLKILVAKLKQDISYIDSQKVDAIRPRGPVNGFVYGQPLDPSNLYKEAHTMLERQTSLESSLKRLEYIDVIVSFAPRVHPTGPSMKKFLVIGAVLSFLLALLFAVAKDIGQKRRMS